MAQFINFIKNKVLVRWNISI